MTSMKSAGPFVELDVGKIQGLTVELNSTFKVEIFYGVPFAEPPVGDNRFEVSLCLLNHLFIICFSCPCP
jgi:carboxylesterase type B